VRSERCSARGGLSSSGVASPGEGIVAASWSDGAAGPIVIGGRVWAWCQRCGPTLRTCRHAPLCAPQPAGLEVAWLGVSGYRLTYEGVSIFIDPYLSRVPLRALLLRRRALADLAMIERYAAAPGEVGGVLVGHTHFDHAVDAPALARRYGTKAYGSASLGHLMRLHGLGELAVEVVPHAS
jgi:glyoxylase-like metal-dependent hydrolase (beta-lactamase superfamily II)